MNNTSVLKDSSPKTFNTCFDNIDLNWARLKNKNLKSGPQFSFFYEYAHDRSILSLSLDESGIYMATGSADHSIRIHNLRTLTTARELYHKKCGHYDWVNEVFFTSRNEILSGGLDGKICLWNTTNCCKIPKVNKIMRCSEYLEQEKKVREIKFKAYTNVITCKEMYAHHSTISDMKFDKKQEKCITSSYDKTLKLFDIKKFHELAIYRGSHLHPITKFLWLQNKIISADKNGTVCTFDVDTSQEVLSAKNTHYGNIGALNYFYLYKSCDESLASKSAWACERGKTTEHDSECSSGAEEVGKCGNVCVTNSGSLFGDNGSYLNLDKGKIPLIITGGQIDGTLKIRDFRIFNKYISCKRIHTASINCIITYNLKNRTYIISCSADGYCYQFEIHSICSSNINNYLKKICIHEPVLSATYIGNHLVLVGSAFGNLFLLNFSDHSKNEAEVAQGKIRKLVASDEAHSDENAHDQKRDGDILWAFGACKKGGINCIECIYAYDSKNVHTNEMEICSIVTAGDDGTPCLLNVPNSFA
ncbi:WD domain G-beta repeat domain containing protein [Plasmodium ovale wallikeri]|uniref:WD domain G-beta repeat domain containing protein n=2 Tax=Plasmodium ovale TaxID=36330 RepID=A0A1A8YUN0_PLAOA|nr:WD domain G-beta repeat domain containing protein [Plasmodium ovale wallikeri]SBT35706.1 WD domain G-beta repeat domain containing protein [Plasmodium ovale wallikeri]SBT77094.1 WD repeat-containing protein, putative [Plasmodium ovale]